MKRAAFVALVIALLGAACDSDSNDGILGRTPRATPSTSDALVIGLVGTMSGPDAWRGEDAFEGADVAVSVLNRSRPPGSPPFDLVTLDDEGDEQRAVELVERLAGLDQTMGIVYAGPPAALPSAETALAEARIPAMLCYGDLYGARQLSAHVFQVSPSLLWEARRIAAYVAKDRGYRRIAVLASRSVDGASAFSALQDALAAQGRDLIARELYAAGEPNFASTLRRLERRRVEAVVVQGPPGTFNRLFAALDDMDARYRTTAAARAGRRPGARSWHPQIIGFDLAISPRVHDVPVGTVASDTYARGAHYLTVPSLQDFRTAFEGWWGSHPLGWQRRAYEATSLIGWATDRAKRGEDLAAVLERLDGRRFGGLDVMFGPDDHTSVGQTTVGLWVVPRGGIDVPERDRLPESMPWVPLARGFSIDGSRTDVLPQDWRYLFHKPPPKNGPGPRFTRLRVGVTTTRSDPVH